MQGLGAEYQVHVRRARTIAAPSLRGHAATHADHHLRAGALVRLPVTELGEHLLLRTLAIEQVLSSSRSASSGLSVSVNPWVCASRSIMRAESYSFIWQPMVLMYSFPAINP